MNITIVNLGSGSSGNATLIISGSYAVLLDCGFTKKELFRRLELCGICPSIIKSILITHEHSDHICGARVVADHLDIETYTNTPTAHEMRKKDLIGKKHKAFITGTKFKLECFEITPFKISHDTAESVGFVFDLNGFRAAYAMDIGTLDNLSKIRIKGCDVIMLESNHDKKMLMASQRPIRLKQRILSRSGHLDNNEAISSFNEIITEKTANIALGHISSDCNKYSLVEDLASSKLKLLSKEHIALKILKQQEPLYVFN